MFEVPNGHKLTITPGLSGLYLLKCLSHDLGSFCGHLIIHINNKEKIPSFLMSMCSILPFHPALM